MKRSSGTLVFLRIFVWVLAIVFAVGYYGHVRAQSAGADSNPSGPGSIRVPLRPLAPLSSVPIPPVFGMEGIIADKTAAIQLGKASSGTCRQAAMISRRAPVAISMPEQTAAPTTK